MASMIAVGVQRRLAAVELEVAVGGERGAAPGRARAGAYGAYQPSGEPSIVHHEQVRLQKLPS